MDVARPRRGGAVRAARRAVGHPPVGSNDSVFFAIPRSRWRGRARTLGQYEAAYDGHLVLLDREIERLFAFLRRAKRWDRTTVFVVGTHGVQFGEAGLYLRGGRYSMADLHVPWILRRAGGVEPGRSFDQLVSLLDLAPTVLELESLPVPPGMHGDSLVPLLYGADFTPRRYAFASCGMQEGCVVIGERHCLEYLIPGGTEDLQMRSSWFGAPRELSVAPELFYYDRKANPYPSLARASVIGSRAIVTEYAGVARQWMDDVNNTRLFLQSSAFLERSVDEATLRGLQEKGYVGKIR